MFANYIKSNLTYIHRHSYIFYVFNSFTAKDKFFCKQYWFRRVSSWRAVSPEISIVCLLVIKIVQHCITWEMETPDFEQWRVYFKQFGAERVNNGKDHTCGSFKNGVHPSIAALKSQMKSEYSIITAITKHLGIVSHCFNFRIWGTYFTIK